MGTAPGEIRASTGRPSRSDGDQVTWPIRADSDGVLKAVLSTAGFGTD